MAAKEKGARAMPKAGTHETGIKMLSYLGFIWIALGGLVVTAIGLWQIFQAGNLFYGLGCLALGLVVLVSDWFLGRELLR